MFDRDLARLYGVETRSLLQAIRRNKKRFPADFLFQLSEQELEDWRSQFVISNLRAHKRVAASALRIHGTGNRDAFKCAAK